jgi:hypothetical protein
VLGKWNEEKASSKEAVSKWNDQEIGVLDGKQRQTSISTLLLPF